MADPSSPLGLLGTLRLLLHSFPPEAPPYCVIGALAVGAWGRPRATRLDLVYLWHWADRLGLQSELHYALSAPSAP
jgi:hypothetical protein